MIATSSRDKLIRLLTDAVPHLDEAYINEVVDPDVVLPEMPGGGQGLAGYKNGLRLYATVFDHESVTAEDVVEDGDKFAVRLRVRGRHIGEVMGVPASGRSFEIQHVMIVEFRDGKVVRFWNVADRMALLRQVTAAA
jgi:predicted ester cyclase